MKVLRKISIETDRLEVGDQIEVKFCDEKYTATAIQREEDEMCFLLDECLDEPKPMNKENRSDGGYDASAMRKYLAQKAKELPEELKTRMVAFENGDYLRLLSLQEVCGIDTNSGGIEDQIEWMKDRRHRITTMKDNEYAAWWLRDTVSAVSFADVGNSGNCAFHYASASLGVRPAFKIRDLQSPPLVGGITSREKSMI